jgi:valyl-tRNA synthetase
MIELPKIFNPSAVENKWYKYWQENSYFESIPSSEEPFTIVIPPPNVTGVLHMGHMLNNTIQDVLIRKARLNGKNACWVPGTDHASIATEAKVVQMLRDKGIKKSELSRDEFLKYAWDWKEKYGGIILKQLEKLGASCDWKRTRFTMEPKLSNAVLDCFIDLYNKDLIYRAQRMVNWDPIGKTALSDEEVIYKEVDSKLFYIKYKLVESDEFLIIATTRPETILADIAICVNPTDERYKHLIGKNVIVPIINRHVSIIADDYVDKEFGTGCLKITPAHDRNDYEIAQKYGLEIIDILAETGILTEACGVSSYIGKDRFEVRKLIINDLQELDLLVKEELYKNQIGTSERTGAIIEPRLTMQWWVDMKKFLKKNPQVLDAVLDDEIKFHPASMKNTYRHWIENIKDWCISRQLWWGQRIPAWYDEEGDYVVAKTAQDALELFELKGKVLTAELIKQDEDVLDTWFSSWLWPISVFDGFEDPDNPDIKYYYPTNDLVTAPEIMFFWVARMIMAGYEWRGQKPFSNVYYTGIVRDKQRRKMSKSLGNSPDPLDLIEKYGADGVRMGMLLCSPAGNDILFDESQVEQGRNFSNKIWNALRLVKGWNVVSDNEVEAEVLANNNQAYFWMLGRLDAMIINTNQLYNDYKLSEVLMSIYKLIWDDFCSWYLEMIKPEFGKGINQSAYNQTIYIFDNLMRILHPYMPFITEEVWQMLSERKEGESICISKYPIVSGANQKDLSKVFEVISKIREFRNSNGISPKLSFDISIKAENVSEYKEHTYLISKLANVSQVFFSEIEPEGKPSFAIGIDKLYLHFELEVNPEEELLKLSKELSYQQGFLDAVMKKLSNEKFVANAKPELIEKEMKKKSDAEAKIAMIQVEINSLKS